MLSRGHWAGYTDPRPLEPWGPDGNEKCRHRLEAPLEVAQSLLYQVATGEHVCTVHASIIRVSPHLGQA